MTTHGLLKSSSTLEDVLINKLLLSHDPDGRCLDSDRLFCAMENIMLYSTMSSPNSFQLPDTNFNAGNAMKEETNIDVIGSEDSLAQTITKISHEISCNCLEDSNLHQKTMSLIDSVANYKWDDKAVLALSAFAKTYGEFWLLIQLYPKNPLAVSVAILKQLPSDITALTRQFMALESLMKTVVDITKDIVLFEGLPLSQVKLVGEPNLTRELHIYSAVYWIFRSILTCSYQISDLIAVKPEQYSDSTTIATWEISSLVHRLRGMSSHLKKQIKECSDKSETKLYQSLLAIFKEENKGNQPVFRMLLAFRDDFPLIDCLSQIKLGLTELENKVVIFLVSKPDLLPIEDSLLLIQRHSISVNETYEIVWIPIPVSNSWTESEKKSFRVKSHHLPWCSIKNPWLLNPAAVRFIRQAWSYKDDPIMVVLNSNGNVTNLNAMDMFFIWGPKAYPFSAPREEELWKEQKWTLELLTDEIDPLLTKWVVEEERCVCLYGSNNTDWVLRLNAEAKEIKKSGFNKLEMIYVGEEKKKKNKSIHAKIEDGEIQSPLSVIKMQFFWIRLESIRRSKLRLGFTIDSDHVLREVSRLIEMYDNGKDWAVIGRGNSDNLGIVRVQEPSKLRECVEKCFSLHIFESEPCCNYSKVVTKEIDERIEAVEACEKCGHRMKKFFVYEPPEDSI